MAVKPKPTPEPEEETTDETPQPRYVELDATVVERFLDNVGSVLGGLFNASPLPAKPAEAPAEGPANPAGDERDDGDERPPAPERKPKPRRNWLLD